MDKIASIFMLILLSLFTYIKILNINNVGFKKIICGILFSGLLACGVFLLRDPMPYTRFALMILVLGAFAGIATKVKFDLALTGIMISSGINYGFLLVFLAVSAFLIYLFSQSANEFLVALSAAAMQAVFIMLLFRIQRFKKGILFLQKRGAGAIGLAISGIIVLASALIGHSDIADRTNVWLFLIGAILCVAGLIFWWRSGITKLYRTRMWTRNLQKHQEILAEKDGQIQNLIESNELMAKLIHRDNKLLPAMYEVVKLFFEHYKGSANTAAQLESKRMMDQIEQLMKERTGIIAQSQRENKILPSTKDTLIDGIINHMMLKASESGIEFNMTVIGDITQLTETIIPVIDLETLFVDLIENAIIATSYSEHKKILITIGINEGFYELNVQDSGIPFEIDTLMNLGLKKASTHLDEGGSGIGYMAIFEILREYKASIAITEYAPKQRGFTKSIRVRFDNKNEYNIQTFRADKFSTLRIISASSPTVSDLV